MESKSVRIEFRLEPTLKSRIRRLCEQTDTPMNKYLGDLIIRDLRGRGMLTDNDIRQMRD